MQGFGIECLIEDATKILASADANQGGCDCAGLSGNECERLHAIHDELVDLECDDVDMLSRIALCLLPCSARFHH